MIEELMNASSRLRVALDQYVRLCSKVQDLCLQGIIPQDMKIEYSEQVDRELGLIESYDVKMQLAKTAIKLTRNYAFGHSSVNRLPTEVLTRIFHMARDAEPRCVDFIAQVCSRWRSIALDTASLWSRVDFYPSSCRSLYPSLSRVHAHLLRSSEIALGVHISAEPKFPKEGYHDRPMAGLCALAAPRMESLELDLERFEPRELESSTHSAIASLFSHCSPGQFTKIITYSGCFGFFTPGPAIPGLLAMNLNMESSQFEAAMASVNVLRLTGLYPPWTSRAYHGLVELRLIASPGGLDSIPEWQLIHILNSSPGLRIIQTSLDITNRVDESQNVSVSLPDLEVLRVDSEALRPHNLCHLELVRFLTPGLRPLDFTMTCPNLQLTESSKTQINAFLLRSNVINFHADRVPCPFNLVSLMPNLKALVLSNCESLPVDQPGVLEASDSQNPPPVLFPKLDICVVLECSFSLKEFQSMVQRCQVQTLMAYSSIFHNGIDGQEVDLTTITKELSAVCPDVKITNTVPRIVEHRDFFFDNTMRVSY